MKTESLFILKHKDLIIGYLTFSNTKWTFVYSDEFKKQDKIIPLTNFPNKNKEYYTENLNNFPFFYSLLPGGDKFIKNMTSTDEINLLKTFGQTVIENPFELIYIEISTEHNYKEIFDTIIKSNQFNRDYENTSLGTEIKIEDEIIISWKSVDKELPKHLETVWISNGKDFTTLGCLIDTEDGYHWAATNGIIYQEDNSIVSECESDDLDVQIWHPLPKLPKRDE